MQSRVLRPWLRSSPYKLKLWHWFFFFFFFWLTPKILGGRDFGNIDHVFMVLDCFGEHCTTPLYKLPPKTGMVALEWCWIHARELSVSGTLQCATPWVLLGYSRGDVARPRFQFLDLYAWAVVILLHSVYPLSQSQQEVCFTCNPWTKQQVQ